MIAAYVSGHGFGHAVREIEILRRVPDTIGLVVKTSSPEWFWRQEIQRPFEFVADAFDVGCLQPNSLDIDVPGTLAAWNAIAARNEARLDDEVADLRRRGVRVVVADVGPFPIRIAERLGVPSVCVANFTWADIYGKLAEAEPAFGPIAADLEAQYARATLLLDTDLSLPMAYFPRRERVGLVARPHRHRRTDLLGLLGPRAEGKRLALIYIGNWGLPIPWARLETFSDWFFVTLGRAGPAANLAELPADAFPHADLVASVDLVVSKAGYGMVGECLSSGTPLLYCPRPEFAEYAALDAALSVWPGGLRATTADFLSVAWDAHLERIPERASVPVYSAGGGQGAAEILTKLA